MADGNKIITVRPAVKDHWRDWGREYSKPPDSFDREAYQERLDKIAGTSRGRSILRVVWGGEEKVKFYSEWSNGAPVAEIVEPKYKVRRRAVLGGHELIPMRRWVIEQLYEWEQYGYGDDSGTTFTNERGETLKAFEKERDYYTPLIFVGSHAGCPKTCSDERLCLGDYKHPDEAELFWVLEKTYLLQTERIVDPRGKTMSEAEKKAVKQETLNSEAEKRKELDSRLDVITT